MSEMVERVARAICGEPRGCDYPQCRCSPSWIVGIDRRSRAALTAMREPTEAMLKAFYGDMPVESRLGDDWRDMIDAALED